MNRTLPQRTTGLLCLAGFVLCSMAEDRGGFRIEERDGRHSLVGVDGKAFFAHGVTHLGVARSEGLDKAVAAFRELGFNSFGYGCPDPVKDELPYLEGRQFVPSSTYRTTDKSFGYVDIFDPVQQAKLDRMMREMCERNRDNPNE